MQDERYIYLSLHLASVSPFAHTRRRTRVRFATCRGHTSRASGEGKWPSLVTEEGRGWGCEDPGPGRIAQRDARVRLAPILLTGAQFAARPQHGTRRSFAVITKVAAVPGARRPAGPAAQRTAIASSALSVGARSAFSAAASAGGGGGAGAVRGDAAGG